MSKIEVLTTWDAHAALHSALEVIVPGDRVLILVENENNGPFFLSANLSRAEGVFLMEQHKWKMFFNDHVVVDD